MPSDKEAGRSSAPRWIPWLMIAVPFVMLFGSWALVTMDQPGVPQMFVVEHKSPQLAPHVAGPEPDAPPPELVRVHLAKTFGPQLSLEQARQVIGPLEEDIARCYVKTDGRVVTTVDFRVSKGMPTGVEIRPRPRQHEDFRACVEATLTGVRFESVTDERPSFVTLRVGRLDN